MIKQGLDYDKEGQFVRLWVPELGGVRGGRVHFPWTVGGAELAQAGVELGVTYPGPMVTPPEWARHTGREAGAGGQQRGVDFYFLCCFVDVIHLDKGTLPIITKDFVSFLVSTYYNDLNNADYRCQLHS